MIKSVVSVALVVGLFAVGTARAQEFPIMEMVANEVIQKYQSSSCETLWAQRMQPPTPQKQEALQALRANPEMRAAFFAKISGPVLSKMFECGMVP